MSRLTRTDQKFLSFALSSLWKLMPGLAGFSCKSNAVVLTAFCSSPVNRARLSVNVSAIRNSIISFFRLQTAPYFVDHLRSLGAQISVVSILQVLFDRFSE